MILTDNETKVDLLNNEAIATTIIRLLRERPEHPISIGVHGDWGAGKSSILEMIEDGLADEKKVLCIKLNGWRFQGFEDAKIALIEGIVNGLLEKRPALTKASATVKELFKKIDWLKVAKRAGGLAFTAYTGMPTQDQINSIVKTIQGVIKNPSAVATKKNLETAIHEVEAVIKPTESENIPHQIDEFRKAFDKLLKDAAVDQLVVLIDDLDRCLPESAIETLEAIRLFVFTERTAFVIAADEAMIEYAVRKHFPDLPTSSGPRDYARNYLEKLIQVPFRIPALGETETRIYVTLLLIGAAIGENHEGYGRLIKAAREKLKRPWTSVPLDIAEVNEALGNDASDVRDALFLSDQIGPILARGTLGNPRQIKRFLNTLLLRQRSAEARGFGDEVKVPALAKLMLAERFIPLLFEQIAITALSNSEGCSDNLGALEEAASGKADVDEVSGVPTSVHKKGPANSIVHETVAQENPMLTEWKSQQDIIAWARVEPLLGKLDLRPYLFATKDKKDYFGPVSALGHLALVAEKLFGSKFTVEPLVPELRQLTSLEAEKLFHHLRNRILANGSFDVRPPGIYGMLALLRAHAEMHGLLIDFLRSLPTSRCGVWVVGGWDQAIKGTGSEDGLKQLIENWAKIEGNPKLKLAAEAVLRQPMSTPR